MSQERVRPKVDFSKDKGRTKQAFKDGCNVNRIVKRFRRTGVMDERVMNRRQAAFGDFSSVGDFRELHDRILRAKEEFDSLPSDVRVRFKNDPGELVSFVDNPENFKACVEMGLLVEQETTAERGQDPKGSGSSRPEPAPEGAEKSDEEAQREEHTEST